MRNKPQQERSRKMLETILEGALDAVSLYGLENTTTRHIAERTGISVGTLYHYFADKEAVFNALQSQLFSDLIAAIRRDIPELVQLSFADSVRGLARLYLRELNRDGGKRLAFMRHIVHRDIGGELNKLDQVVMEYAMQFIARNPEVAHVSDMPTVMYLLFNSLAFNLMRYIENPPPNISEDALVDGFANMAVAYMTSQMPTEALVQLSDRRSRKEVG